MCCAEMFSSTELKTLQLALPTLNSLSVADLECLCNAAIARIKAETTPSNERHLGKQRNRFFLMLLSPAFYLHLLSAFCFLISHIKK